MNTTSSTSSCSASLDEKCAPESYSMAGLKSLPIPHYLPVFGVKRLNNTYEGMQKCCGDKPVTVYDDCMLWCEVSDANKDAIKNSDGKFDDNDILRHYFACLRAQDDVDFIIGGGQSAALPGAQPPTLTGLGLLALAVSGIVTIMG